MEWIIYKHTNKANGKSYIGQTIQDANTRWKNGLGYKNYKKTASVFFNAIKKYGWNNFSHEIIEKSIPSQEKANEREIYWIEHFRSYIGFIDCNGYNMTLGGNSGNHLGYAVYQISKENLSIVNKFSSTAEASRLFGSDKNASQIRRCCEGLKVSCKGYYWCYAEKYFVGWRPKKNELVSPVYQINDELLVIKKYDSITECAKQNGFSAGSIVSCCNGKQQKANGYHWCYELEYTADWTPPVTKFKRNEKIYCFETEKVYESAKEASEDTGANQSHILRCCKGLENGANGMHFCYFRDKVNYNCKITQKHGLPFTDDENKLLRIKYPEMGICDELLKLFPSRSSDSLRQQAHRLHLQYCGKSKANKKVFCVELSKTFDSIEEARIFCGLKTGVGIGLSCMGKRKTAGGYQWKYIDDE